MYLRCSRVQILQEDTIRITYYILKRLLCLNPRDATSYIVCAIKLNRNIIIDINDDG